MKCCKWWAVLCAAVLLAGCAPALVKQKGDAAMRAAQRKRATALAGADHWTIQARLGVSDGHHGGSGDLTWVQDGTRYVFTLRAPITGRSFELRGGPGGAELQGLKGGPVYGADAQRLLARALGWQVPMRQLRRWVLGLRARGSGARLAFGADGLPSQIVQDGWTVQYPAWYAQRDPALPRKVFAQRADYRVRVVIESWSFK